MTATRLALMTTRSWPAAAFALGGFWLWYAASWTEPKLPERWVGDDTELGAALGRESGPERHLQLAEMVRRLALYRAKIVVLPESALGPFTPTIERFWTDALAGLNLTVIAGAAVIDGQG